MDLKPCPFCGGKCCVCEAITNIWQAHCQDCDCSVSTDRYNMGFVTQQEAVEVWNRRHNDTD